MHLVLSDANDVHAGLVEQALSDRGHRSVRLTAESYPECVALEAKLRDGVVSGFLRVGAARFALSDIASVWWHSIPARNTEGFRVSHRDWVVVETISAIETVVTGLQVPIFPDPDKARRAGRKWRQLAVASDVGFSVPETIITSDARELRAFAEHGSVVFKTLSHPCVPDDQGFNRFVYTNRLADEDYARAQLLRESVGWFQRYVEKVRDIRVTVVGDQVFAIAIESQASSRTSVDWRRYDIARTPHSVIEPSTAMRRGCLEFLRRFEIQFGCFDFAEDADGNWWFLEVNPNGLWAWLEILTGAPIAAAIASQLISLTD